MRTKRRRLVDSVTLTPRVWAQHYSDFPYNFHFQNSYFFHSFFDHFFFQFHLENIKVRSPETNRFCLVHIHIKENESHKEEKKREKREEI